MQLRLYKLLHRGFRHLASFWVCCSHLFTLSPASNGHHNTRPEGQLDIRALYTLPARILICYIARGLERYPISASQESVCGNDHFSADVQKPSYLCIVQSQGSGAVERKSHAVSGGSAHIHVIEDTSKWVGLTCRASSAFCMPFLACSAWGHAAGATSGR